MRREWWRLTDEEAERLNPPPSVLVLGDDDNWYMLEQYHEEWQPVGHIPQPRTRIGWFVYHLVHGLAMRYPWWKVIGFAFTHTRPGEINFADKEGDL